MAAFVTAIAVPHNGRGVSSSNAYSSCKNGDVSKMRSSDSSFFKFSRFDETAEPARHFSREIQMSVQASPVKLNTQRSQEIFKQAQELMPGGVSSPVRAFKSVGGQPIVFDRVNGPYAWDVDGNKYIDYVGSWGPAICGHAHPDVVAALKEAIDKGASFGAPCEKENVLAQMVIDAVPSIEMVRFVNSGTEACMSVLRLMRAYTQREKVIKFEGCYHGHADMFLVKAGSGVATLGLPDSPGVPKSTTASTLTAPYNDLDAVKKLFEENPGEIAGIILEPVVGNAGFIAPQPGFLAGLKELAEKNRALLCFDEVMTGFRIAYGGAQEKFGITPDLTTLGKVIGGGLPVGAYGGRKEIMRLVAPAGPMYQAGTLSGNPLAMTAGIKTLELLQRPGSYEYLEKITKRLSDGVLQICKDTGHVATGSSISAMFGMFFCEGPVNSYEDAKATDTAKFGRFHRAMLEEGIYLAPSSFEAGFTSLAHTDADIDRTLEAAEKVLKSL
mmetsp:Transcript_29957/g.50286  ORF Transcript_29957/g.50286 Transcript_29957/m.50286 type:complete len:499 (+) Transcript_29957:46-1542(+)